MNITLSGTTYVVDFQVFGYTAALPGRHVHFFFNTVAPDNAGVPGKGPVEGVRHAQSVPAVPGRRPSGRRGPDVHPRRQPRPFDREGHRQLRGPAVLTVG